MLFPNDDVNQALQAIVVSFQDAFVPEPGEPVLPDNVFALPYNNDELQEALGKDQFPIIVVSKSLRSQFPSQIQSGFATNETLVTFGKCMSSHSWFVEIDIFIGKTSTNVDELARLEEISRVWPSVINNVLIVSDELRTFSQQEDQTLIYVEHNSLSLPTRTKSKQTFYGYRIVKQLITTIEV